MRRLAAFLALPALVTAVGVVLISPGAAAQGARTITFTELEKGSTFTHIRNTKVKSRQANAAGDLITFTNPLANASGGRIGKLYVDCVTTVGARNFLKSVLTCTGIVELADGTLTLQANTSPADGTTNAAVTGGTGAYANANGVYVSKEAPGGSSTTITLEG